MANHEISLNARWVIHWFDEGRGELEGAHLPTYDASGWLDAIVPGDVHLDLMRAGLIPDPFFGLNHLECRWMEEKEWWYRREFDVPCSFEGRRVELQFGGLDTFATVWVNGKLAGKHRNMFVPCTFDVSSLLRYGHRNTVAVCFGSPLKAVEGRCTDGLNCAFDTHERLYARKAQMSYGWDIAPRLITTGIWRPAYLVARGSVSLDDVAIRTVSVSPQEALLGFHIFLRRNNESVDECDLQIEIRSNAQTPVTRCIPVSFGPDEQVVSADIAVPNPKLWWPWNVGKPNLYSISVSALVHGEVEEAHKTKFGIRTVELVQEPQEDGGRSFFFRINGQPVYARGTNWIPADAIFARVTRRKYRDLLDLALNNNINMFRIWGGGIYEDPYFYRLCDERGIMVWQDFMFSCAEYPEDDDFVSEVRYEAEKVVAGLRNHPSVVIWCGDNEIDIMKHWWKKDFRSNKINREVLPQVCSSLDPTRPYLWSSPCSPFGDPDPQSQTEGDRHNWNHGVHYLDDVYRKDCCRFVSEIGHLSVPWPESIQSFIPHERMWPPENQVWDYHFGTTDRCDPGRRACVDRSLAHLGFERPNTLEEYAYLSQMVQALALKEWMEHYRRRKFLCGGSLYWNLYDNWPQFSDAVVDHYGRPKIAYYFVSRAFSNLLVSLEDLGEEMVGVWLINDTLKERSGKLLLRCQRLDGGTAWVRVLPAKLPANSSRMVWDMKPPRPLMQSPCECFVQAQLIVGGRVVSESFIFPGGLQDVKWPQTELTVRVHDAARPGGKLRADVIISSKLYARLVRVETPGVRSSFSDNFFDVPPGAEKVVRVTAASSSEPIHFRVTALNAQEAVEATA